LVAISIANQLLDQRVGYKHNVHCKEDHSQRLCESELAQHKAGQYSKQDAQEDESKLRRPCESMVQAAAQAAFGVQAYLGVV
jgi:hypothetical protein